MALVSVIIPTFNCELYIAETIGSVLQQSFTDAEIIVIDDGSTDSTTAVVKSFGNRVQLITQSNGGVCSARNRGIRQATGQYICLMDHDDYWFSSKIERQLQEFEAVPEVGVVYSSFIPWRPDLTSGAFPSPSSFDLTIFPDGLDPDFSGWIYHQLLLDCWMLTSTAMFRREVFDRCGVFDEKLPYSEDWDLWIRISREYLFSKLLRPTTLYRQHPQQGNRMLRDLDYRTILLRDTVDRWGFSSRDGRKVTRRDFDRQLSIYHADFAFSQLKAGHRKLAINSFIKAWVTRPFALKYLLYVPAAVVGWKPSW